MENGRSKWFGLWKNDDKHYMISQPIEKESLNDTFRIIIKKNKFYTKDSNRPNYCFAIGSDYSSADNTISGSDLWYYNFDDLKERIKTVFEEALVGCPYSMTDDDGYEVFIRDWVEKIRENVLKEIEADQNENWKNDLSLD